MTKADGDRLSQILDDEKCEPGVAVRFVLDEGKIAMSLDRKGPDDKSLAHDGRTVLLLDEEVSPLLADTRLDVDPVNSKLMLVREEPPQA